MSSFKCDALLLNTEMLPNTRSHLSQLLLIYRYVSKRTSSLEKLWFTAICYGTRISEWWWQLI